MKHVFAWIWLIGLVSCACAEFRRIPYNPATMQFPVSPEQAANTARTWVGNPTLELNLLGVLLEDTAFQTEQYVFESPDGQLIKVSPYTGFVWSWGNRTSLDAYQEQIRQDLSNPIPRLSAQLLDQIALQFARDHYLGFDDLNMQRVLTEDLGSVVFGTALPGGGYFSGNYCTLSLNVFSGEVVGYSCLRSGATTVPVAPTLTSDQAAAFALASFSGAPGVASAFTYNSSQRHVILDSLGQQRVVWVTFVATSTNPNLTFASWQQQSELGATRHHVYVDAHNGQVINQETFLGGGGDGKPPLTGWRSKEVRFRTVPASSAILGRRRRTAATAPEIRVIVDGKWIPSILYPPLVDRGTVYWYVGYLKSRLWGMSVRRDGAQLTITDGKGQRFVFRDGARDFLVGEKRLLSSAAPRVTRGRTYLPAPIWEAVTGAKFTYVARDRALRISRPSPTAPRRSGGGSPLAGSRR